MALALWIMPASGQNTPRIGYVYPAGGQKGTTFHIKVGGQFLKDMTNAYLSGGVGRAVFVEYNRPMPQNMFNDLRNEFLQLQDKQRTASQNRDATNAWTSAHQSRLAEIRKRILKNPPNRQGHRAISESVTLLITLAADAATGEHELRLGSASALSNPLVFCVGELPEVTRPAAKTASADLNFLKPPGAADATAAPPDQGNTTVVPPAIVNGQILPGAEDHFRFHARQGQRLVLSVAAQRLIPYLADAVPGWFQAALTVHDGSGKELAACDDYRFHPDPVICFDVPRDGDYVVKLRDALYRGREDFVYRLTLGSVPFVTGMFPLGGTAGATTRIELNGWNLSEPSLAVPTEQHDSGIRLVCPKGSVSRQLPFAVDTLPEAPEQEGNDDTRRAQIIRLPAIINGRIQRPGDHDLFRFEGSAGDVIAAEVQARRLESPLDATLTLIDDRGRRHAFNDDTEDKAAGLTTHHADARLRATLPHGGRFFVRIADAQGKGGAEYAYRLRISRPRPDYELRVTPSSVSVRAGASVPLTVHAVRKDGFDGEILLTVQNAPPGFVLSEAVVPRGQSEARIILQAPSGRFPEPVSLCIAGRATEGGETIERPAIPCDEHMQAFAYRHLVPAKELKVLVRSGARQQNRK